MNRRPVIAGALFVTTSLAATALAGPPPSGDQPARALASHYAHRHGRLLASDVLFAVAAVLLVRFVARLRPRIPAAYRAALAAALLMLLDAVVEAILTAVAAGHSDPKVVSAWFDVSRVGFAVTFLPLAVLVVTAAPPRHRPAIYVLAAVLVLGSGYALSASSFMTTLAGAAYVAFLAWAGAVTVLAARIPPYGSRPGEPRIRGPL